MSYKTVDLSLSRGRSNRVNNIAALTEEYRKRRPTVPPPPKPATLPRVEAASADAPSPSAASVSSSQPPLPEQTQRIHDLCVRLGEPEPDYLSLTLGSAKELLSILMNKYRALKARAS